MLFNISVKEGRPHFLWFIKKSSNPCQSQASWNNLGLKFWMLAASLSVLEIVVYIFKESWNLYPVNLNMLRAMIATSSQVAKM